MERKECTGAFFDESLNRTKTEGGVKEKIQWPATLFPLQCFLKTLWYYIIYTEGWQLRMYLVALILVNHYMQHYAITLNDILRAHLNCQASTIGGEAEEGCASVCKMRRGAGCAVVKWKLCGGNLSRLGFGAVHSHACIIYPFSLASMHPLSSELPHHIGPLCSHSSSSKTRNWSLTSDSSSTASVHETIKAKTDTVSGF